MASREGVDFHLGDETGDGVETHADVGVQFRPGNEEGEDGADVGGIGRRQGGFVCKAAVEQGDGFGTEPLTVDPGGGGAGQAVGTETEPEQKLFQLVRG